MARLKFESLRFREEKDKVEIVFMRLFHFFLDKTDLLILTSMNQEQEENSTSYSKMDLKD